MTAAKSFWALILLYAKKHLWHDNMRNSLSNQEAKHRKTHVKQILHLNNVHVLCSSRTSRFCFLQILQMYRLTSSALHTISWPLLIWNHRSSTVKFEASSPFQLTDSDLTVFFCRYRKSSETWTLRIVGCVSAPFSATWRPHERYTSNKIQETSNVMISQSDAINKTQYPISITFD